MIKRLLYSVAASLTIISCSKLSQSDILGEWTVGCIQVQEITADTDSGWKTQQGAGIVFVQGEIITFEKGRIIPCKSVDMGFRQYDNYPGYVSYTFSGAKLTIPSVEYWVLKIIKPWEVADFSATGARERPINRGLKGKMVTSHRKRA